MHVKCDMRGCKLNYRFVKVNCNDSSAAMIKIKYLDTIVGFHSSVAHEGKHNNVIDWQQQLFSFKKH